VIRGDIRTRKGVTETAVMYGPIVRGVMANWAAILALLANPQSGLLAVRRGVMEVSSSLRGFGSW
jgi:hypothetical protein